MRNVKMAFLCLRSSQVRCLYVVLLTLWGFGFILIHLTENGLSLNYLFQYSTMIDSKSLKRFMLLPGCVLTQSNESALTPLERIYVRKANVLHYYDLPKRKTFATYTEVTTANRDTRFPLAPDFTFHVRYGNSCVTLYEDYGPGCVFRMYLFPPLPTDSEVIYKMTSKDLASLSLSLVIDGRIYRYSLQQIMEGKTPPFISPLSTQHPTPASGMGSYTPFCYQHSMIVYYDHDRPLPGNLFHLTINCTANELACPVKLYSSISRHKYPGNTKVVPFRADDIELASVANIASLLNSPELHGPDAGKSCVLECIELCSKCQRVVFHRIHSAGVLSSMKFRVFDSNSDKPATDWSGVLLSAYFDVENSPQIHRVPLGSLFGAVGSLNDFKGAAFGRRSKYCRYSDGFGLPETSTTGYFYFPMPYWNEALVVLEGSEYLASPLTVCYQVTSSRNHYRENDTGYLHLTKSYFSADASGWRSVLNVSNGWGHLVALSMEIDNLRAIRDVPLAYRWAVLQADNVIYIDGAKSATVMGTGLEDYFSYAHGFSQAENTTYAFVGVYHTSPKRKEPLTWHCYRQHVLDPIPFRSALQFIMEGTDSKKFMTEVKPLDYRAYRLRKLDDLPIISHLVMYYYRPNVDGYQQEASCDQLTFCDKVSEQEHNFQIMQATSEGSGKTFSVDNRRFLGDSANDRKFSACGRSFVNGDSFQFLLTAYANKLGKDLVLIRTFHSEAFQWNDVAELKVNDFDLGRWFIPMGSLSDEYTLREEEFVLPHLNSVEEKGNIVARITIKPLSHWRDVSYKLCFM